jgi:RNA polymerase sigma-70 factor, ECF subfamily
MPELDPLIRRAQDGDPQALRDLFHRYRADVARIAFRVLGPSADLEDVVQEAFVQLYRSLASYRGNAKFSTWLYRVVTNVARMHRRRERSRPQLERASKADLEQQTVASGGPEAEVERGERLRALYRHLEALSDLKRTVLVLHDLVGLPASEIAEIVGAPVLTVRTRLFYARKELYAALAADPALAEVAPRPSVHPTRDARNRSEERDG